MDEQLLSLTWIKTNKFKEIYSNATFKFRKVTDCWLGTWKQVHESYEIIRPSNLEK